MFGVALLQERETVLGLAGSAAIAAGVVTVNSAKIAKGSSAALSQDSRGGVLVQYSPVVTSPCSVEASEASPDAKAPPERRSWQDWSARATEQLANMHSGGSSDGAEARYEAQPLHVPELTGLLPEPSSAQLTLGSKAAGEELGNLELPRMGTLGTLRKFQPDSWTAHGSSAFSPRLRRSSMELHRLGQANGISLESNGVAPDLSEGQTVHATDTGSQRQARMTPDRRSLDRGRNLRDSEHSFGDWHFTRTPAK